MPPMPNPVRTRQMDRLAMDVTVVAPSMPPAITTRHPSTVGLRPMRSATLPSTTEPMAMPMSSIDNTKPSAARSMPHSVAIPGEAKLIDRMS